MPITLLLNEMLTRKRGQRFRELSPFATSSRGSSIYDFLSLPLAGAEDVGRSQLDGVVPEVGHPDSERGDGHSALEVRRRRHLRQVRRPAGPLLRVGRPAGGVRRAPRRHQDGLFKLLPGTESTRQ